MGKFNDDFAYNTSLKRIWNRSKGKLKLNQCMNAFQVIKPAHDSHNFRQNQQNILIKPPKLTPSQFEAIAADPTGFSKHTQTLLQFNLAPPAQEPPPLAKKPTLLFKSPSSKLQLVEDSMPEMRQAARLTLRQVRQR
mmetsp:Transcript_13367/g.22750  ORF Transcript_13367/g.22750 Transcript_13367/m.22750 type:complete len:137 (+) Transcript_13367:390-800(+)